MSSLHGHLLIFLFTIACIVARTQRFPSSKAGLPPPIDRSATKVSARGPTKATRALDHGIATKAVQQE
jgi:hypothetical protein